MKDPSGVTKGVQKYLSRGEELGFTEDELVFHNAVETPDSTVKIIDDWTLYTIVQELEETVRENATTDGTARESVRAGMRNAVRRVLRKHRYPTDKQEEAIQ